MFHSLVKNHAFHNGNKRTALVTLVTFLWRNDRRFTNDVADDDVFEMVLAIANNEFPEPSHALLVDDVVAELGSWLKQRTNSLRARPSGMRTKAFLESCEKAGLKWKVTDASYVVWKDRKHSIRFSRATHELDGPVVREYLNQLGLDVRVEEFQEGLSAEQNEIRRFRAVLRSLAHA